MRVKQTMSDKLRAGFVYYLLSTVLLAVVFLTYLLRAPSVEFMDIGGWFYYVSSCLSHAALFAALPFLLLFFPMALVGAKQKWCGCLMCAGEVLVVTVFIVNAFVYSLYHFHINGLVLDLLTGPGATEIFVFSPWLYAKIVIYLLAIIAVCTALWWMACRIVRRPLHHLWRNGLLSILAITLLAQ